MENGISRLVVGVTLVLGCASFLSSTTVLAASAASLPEHVPGELIVKFKPSFSAVQAKAQIHSVLTEALGSQAVSTIRTFQTDEQLHKVVLKDEQQLASARVALESDEAIAYAEPNFIYRLSMDPQSGTPSDPDFSKLWGLSNTGQIDMDGQGRPNQAGTPGSDVNVMPLWNQGITGSRNVIVAVIDTGIDLTHPDLQPNLWKNEREVPGNGIDDDGNGFIDDVNGWNFSSRNNNPNDDHNHGSHCAGTIGAKGNDGRGVVGVNWDVRLMAIKFLSGSGSGTSEGGIESINYARANGARIISASWGGGGFSQAMFESIVATQEAGVLFVAAAGNDKKNNDATPSYPAGYDVANIVSVAATDNKDLLASFSNYGAQKVHVSAPGKNILSCWKNGAYGIYSGTSMATPHVSGIAALVLSEQPDLSYTELKRRLIATSDRVPSLKKRSVSKGRVDAFQTFNNIVPPNNEPDDSLWRDVAYSLESAHPYENSTDRSWEIVQPGARFVRVFFEKVDVETNYDKVFVQDASGGVVDQLSGAYTGYVSEYVQGDKLTIRLTSDSSVNRWGFKVGKIQVIH